MISESITRLFSGAWKGRRNRSIIPRRGAQVLRDLANGGDAFMAQIIGYCILAHHTGLPDRLDGPGTFDHRMKQPLSVDPVWMEELKAEVADLVPAMVRRFPNRPRGTRLLPSFHGPNAVLGIGGCGFRGHRDVL